MRCNSVWSTTTRLTEPPSLRASEHRAELVAGADVGRVGDADEQAAALEEADRDRVPRTGFLRGEPPDCGRVDLGRVEVEELEVVLLGERARDRGGLDPTSLDEKLTKAKPRALLVHQRELELLVRDQPFADEEGAER